MCRRILFVSVLIATLMIHGTALAQDAVPQHSDTFWQASYWNNMDLSGKPVLQRSEANLDNDWGSGSPAPSVAADNFSARWSRYLELMPGVYRFTTTSDDGIRVSVDGEWLINEWYDHAAQTVSADRNLDSGHHLVIVEFYENGGDAVAKFSWAPVSIANWRGEYFDNKALSGSPVLVRDDAQINFSWGSGSPAPGVVPGDGFSVRWTRSLSLEAGTYRFSTTIDDGGRLWVNGHLLIDAWRDQPPRTYTGDIYLPGGAVPVKMEYYENAGSATARLSWKKAGDSSGAVIIDDTSAGFAKGGSATSWRTAPEGYGGRLLWTKSNDRVRPNYNWARWYPKLQSGRYEVSVYIPHRYTTTARARYWISHSGGYTLRIVNQSAYSDQWVSLGTYWFQGNSNDYASLADVTFEPYLSRLIAFDAVKWVPR